VRQFVEEISISASAQDVFTLFEDVSRWKEWDPNIASALISGEFATGTTGELQPRKGPLLRFKLISVENNKGFFNQFKLPLCTATFHHKIVATKTEVEENETVQLVSTVVFASFLAFPFSRIIGPQLRRELKQTLQGLKSAAEAIPVAEKT